MENKWLIGVDLAKENPTKEPIGFCGHCDKPMYNSCWYIQTAIGYYAFCSEECGREFEYER